MEATTYAGQNLAISNGSDNQVVAPGVTFDNLPELQDVLGSKTWAGSGGSPSRIIFDSPRAMLDPYLNHMDMFSRNGTIEGKVTTSNQVANINSDGTRNVSFGRVKVEFTLPDQTIIGDEAFNQVFAVVYAFDLSKPEVIVYAGRNAYSCMNLHMFQNDNMLKADYLTGTSMAYDTFRRFTETYDHDRENFKQTVSRLMETRWTENQLHRNIGKMLTHVLGSNSFGTSALNHAVKLLYDSGSVYMVNGDGSTTAWNFLQALTQYVTDKSPVNVSAAKTLQMSNFVLGLS